MSKNARQDAKSDWEVQLQREAFEMKLRTGMKLGHCYETIAKGRGYNTYAALLAAMKEYRL
jgi:hypothetical protein